MLKKLFWTLRKQYVKENETRQAEKEEHKEGEEHEQTDKDML